MYSDTGGSLSPCAFAGIEFIIAVSPQQYRFLPEKQFAETADRPRFPAEVQSDQLGETGPAVPEFPLRHPGTSVSGFSGIFPGGVPAGGRIFRRSSSRVAEHPAGASAV